MSHRLKLDFEQIFYYTLFQDDYLNKIFFLPLRSRGRAEDGTLHHYGVTSSGGTW